ncbi:integrase [Catenulispora sp. GAS73]
MQRCGASEAPVHAALGAVRAQQLVTINVAALAELESGPSPKALVWTPERVARWRVTGEVPSTVMVWTAQQTKTFLERAAGHSYFTLFHLVAFLGLRRGEACGLRWSDVDLDARTVSVLQQIVQVGWATEVTTPKSGAGERDLALAEVTVGVLNRHQQAQRKAKAAAGTAWIDSGLVSTKADGDALHPAWVSDEFKLLVKEADLPPIRLHDLRHGAASLALAGGVDVKVVSEMLGHSTTAITRDTYTAVFDELKHAAAAAIAAAINGARPGARAPGASAGAA